MSAKEKVDASPTAWISWLRTAAIVAVLTIHTTASTAAAPDARESTVGVVAIGVDLGAHWAVPVFVMVSGALNLDPDRYRGARDFWRRRVLRLVPAVVFWHAWYIGVRWLRGDTMEAADLAQRVYEGEIFTQLYFFWIVLGLSAVTPLLMPLLRRWGRRGAGVAGLVGAGGTAVAAATLSMADVENAVLWWLPYLGVYLLGFALAQVRLRGVALALTIAAGVVLGLALPWQWENAAAPAWLQSVAPVSYYGAGMVLYSVIVFVVAHALMAPDGVLRRLALPPASRMGRLLGDATLGLFGFHMTVIAVMTATGLLGVDEPATDLGTLLLRVLVVVVASVAVVLPLRRVPVLRRVL